MQCNWPVHYHKVLITVNSQAANSEHEFSDYTIERNVVHELCHLLLSPTHNLVDTEFQEDSMFAKMYTGAQELAIEEITQIFMRMESEQCQHPKAVQLALSA